MEIYCVIEFDFDGKFSDVVVYTSMTPAAEKVAEIYQTGGEAEICVRNIK